MPKKKKNPEDRKDPARPARKIRAPASDLQRINHTAAELSSEAVDVLDYQSCEE